MDLMTYALCNGNGGGGGSSNKFIVTLTPTAQDFSGTMDKTLNEVYSAYEAGMEIVAHVPFNGAVIEAKLVQIIDAQLAFPSFYWMAIEPSQNMQILAYNSTNADEPNPTPFSYSTKLYALTPVS